MKRYSTLLLLIAAITTGGLNAYNATEKAFIRAAKHNDLSLISKLNSDITRPKTFDKALKKASKRGFLDICKKLFPQATLKGRLASFKRLTRLFTIQDLKSHHLTPESAAPAA